MPVKKSSTLAQLQGHKYQEHLKRLAETKSKLDSHIPPNLMSKLSESGKHESQALKQRQALIQHENEILCQRVEKIMTRQNQITEPRKLLTNPHIVYRERQAKRIERENERLVERITKITQKSAYDRKEFLQDFESKMHFAHKHREEHKLRLAKKAAMG